MDMDLLAELENMAIVAQNDLGDNFDEQITRFQTLFQYSYSEAKFVLEQHRATSRTRLSQMHTGKWSDTRRRQKDTTGRRMNTPLVGIFKHQDILLVPYPKAIYLVKLEGPLDCPEMIQALSKMSEFPAMKEGSGATGDARFCVINGEVKATIASVLKSHPFGLCDPMLPDDANHVSLPTQDQYPVWYFVYGNLTNPEFLVLKLGLSETPVLRPAMIKGGIVKIWKGKYKALIDGPADAIVEGWAYEVTSEEYEGVLRYYESDQYEVVRCKMTMTDNGEPVYGVLFKFVGELD